MLSTQPEERPTAEEILQETRKNTRQQIPQLISANQLDEFLRLQELLVDLLPKQSFQRKRFTITFEQWTRRLSERVAGLRKQTSEVINVSYSIDMLGALLMHLQDPMTNEDLAKACSLLKNIEERARISHYRQLIFVQSK